MYSVEWVGDDAMNDSEDLEGGSPGVYASHYTGFCLEQGEYTTHGGGVSTTHGDVMKVLSVGIIIYYIYLTDYNFSGHYSIIFVPTMLLKRGGFLKYTVLLTWAKDNARL
jgi:hypothetical protein